MSNKKELINALSDIYQFLYDSYLCIDKHISNTKNPRLKKLFKTISRSRKRMINEIHEVLLSLGHEEVLLGTVMGKAHMIFENLKVLMTHEEDLAITKEIRRGEGVLIDLYKKALILKMEPALKKLLLAHMVKIQEDVDASDVVAVK